MPWLTLVSILIWYVGPLLLQWLVDLLNRTRAALEDEKIPTTTVPAVQEMVFWGKALDLMEKDGEAIWSWNWIGKSIHKKKLDILRRVIRTSMTRIGQFTGSATPVPLSDEETKYILTGKEGKK